jgi:hypothetical protein
MIRDLLRRSRSSETSENDQRGGHALGAGNGVRWCFRHPLERFPRDAQEHLGEAPHGVIAFANPGLLV